MSKTKSMLMPLPSPKKGELRVWWVPQIPMESFEVIVKDIEQAKFLLRTLAQYDIFQFEQNVKPDYSNAGGLKIFDEDGSGEWYEWCDENGDDIDQVMRNEEEADE